MHEREADKVMAESYKQRQGGSQEQRVTSKAARIIGSRRVTSRGRGGGSQEQRVTSKGS